MAESHSKRNVRRAQPAHSSVTTPTTPTTPNAKTDADWLARLKKKSFQFPRLKGKVLQGVEFTSSPDYDSITLNFQDKTFVDFIIETCFSVKADYLDRSTATDRVLKRWPRIHSVRFRRR